MSDLPWYSYSLFLLSIFLKINSGYKPLNQYNNHSKYDYVISFPNLGRRAHLNLHKDLWKGPEGIAS